MARASRVHVGGACRVIFRVAAGPRLGYGHLVRGVRLARALGVSPTMSLRGGAAARAAARAVGCELVSGSPSAVLATRRPDMVVVDDPDGWQARRWCAVVSRRGTPVASVHDLGIGVCESDLVIDGSITRNAYLRRRRWALVGPRYAVVDAGGRSRARRWLVTMPPRVLIALGGGRCARRNRALIGALRALRPALELRVAGGLGAGGSDRVEGCVTWLPPGRGLVEELAGCAIAIVGGGITPYEGCALGVPMVAVATVPAQRPTVRAFAAAGALIDGGALVTEADGLEVRARRIAQHAQRLLGAERTRARLARTGRSLVDGRGAARVATRLLALAGRAAQGAA